MKKRFLLTLCFTLCFTLMLSSALAVTPQTALAKIITDALDAKGWAYTVNGMVNDGKDEHLYLKFDAENVPDGIKVNILARDSVERVQFFIWNIIEYDDADFAKVLRTVNKLNNEYVYVKFYCDESDNTVTAEFDAYTPTSMAGEIVIDMLYSMVDIVDEAYEVLSPYDS